MRSARGAYAQSIRAELHAIGIDDLPRNGAFILAGIDTSGGPRQDLPSELGVTKQAVSLVIDTLVNRGYLDRRPDPDDRRRVDLELTDRGREAVDASFRGVEAVDRRLEERVSREQIDAMRTVAHRPDRDQDAAVAAGAGRRRPQRELRRFSPIFPVRDLRRGAGPLRRARLRDARLRPRVRLRRPRRPRAPPCGRAEHDSAHTAASAYLYVRDADALYKEWSRPGVGGRTHPGRRHPLQTARGFPCRPRREPDPLRFADRGVTRP